MKSQNYKLNNELEEGLINYASDHNTSTISIIEDLVEDFLCREGYLKAIFPPQSFSPQKIKFAPYNKTKEAYEIQKSVEKRKRHYGVTPSSSVATEIVHFLEEVNWDTKYSTAETGLRSVNQINFLLNEIEKIKEESE